jgi:short-chain fatty acids transporter
MWKHVEAFNTAARVVGSLLLQYPIYGGTMGIMTATGPAAVSPTGSSPFQR